MSELKSNLYRSVMAAYGIAIALCFTVSPAAVLAAPFAYITNSASNNVSVIDTETNSVVATIPVGEGPFGVAVNTAGTRAYVTNSGGNTVSVVETESNTVVATMVVGSAPKGIAVSPDGTRVYVANSGSNSVTVIDTTTDTVSATAPVEVQPYGVAVNAAGTRLYLTSLSSTELTVLDTTTNSVVSKFWIGNVGRGIALNVEGTRALIAASGAFTTVDIVNNTWLEASGNIGPEDGIAINSFGTLAYTTVPSRNAVEVRDVKSSSYIQSVQVGTLPSGVAVSPAGTRVYVANAGSDNVSVIDATTNTVLSTVSVGGTPMGVAIGGMSLASNATCGPAITIAATPVRGLCASGTPGAVSGTGPWSWTCTGRFGTGNAACTAPLVSVIDHYYLNVLDRVPDAMGKFFWQTEMGRMAGLGANPKETYIAMARYFFTSAEFAELPLNDDGYVRKLYATFFNREADQGGLDYWKGVLASGLPRDMAMYYFMFSTEFNSFMASNVGGPEQRAEVGAVIDYYRGAFGRLPDDGGMKYWVNRFREAQCSNNATGNVYQAAIDIAGGFFGGADYWVNPAAITHTKYVSDLYNAFMRRSADLAGFNYWVSALANNNPNHTQMRKSFIDTPEFAARVQAITAQGCTTQMQ